MAFDATVGGASANSYLSVAAFNAILATRSNAPSSATDAEKQVALTAATARLEQESYGGSAATLTQRLKWPRVGVENDDGVQWDWTTIPYPLAEATADLAIELLNDPAFLERSGLTQFEELSVGPISLTPRVAGLLPGDLPASVTRWLRLLRTTLTGQAPIIRG